MKWYRKSAEQDYAEAQVSLGVCYEKGEGVEKSAVDAKKWYEKAALQGYARGQFYLGDCYKMGVGVEKNVAEAVKWYRKAAEQGSAEAAERLKSLGIPTSKK